MRANRLADEDNFKQYANDQLLLLIKQQNTEALEVLYDRHAQIVYNLLVRIVTDIELAERLLQAVFLQLWQDTDASIGTGMLIVWLSRQARTKALEQIRLQPAIAAQFSSKPVGELTAQARQVESILQKMPAEQRQCLELAYFAGMSQVQIASYTLLPLETVKSHLRIGLEMIAAVDD